MWRASVSVRTRIRVKEGQGFRAVLLDLSTRILRGLLSLLPPSRTLHQTLNLEILEPTSKIVVADLFVGRTEHVYILG